MFTTIDATMLKEHKISYNETDVRNLFEKLDSLDCAYDINDSMDDGDFHLDVQIDDETNLDEVYSLLESSIGSVLNSSSIFVTSTEEYYVI